MSHLFKIEKTHKACIFWADLHYYSSWLKIYQLKFSFFSLKRDTNKTSFSEGALPMYALDLHFAGTDTTSNTLLTAFLYLMNHPHVQGMYLQCVYALNICVGLLLLSVISSEVMLMQLVLLSKNFRTLSPGDRQSVA